jgi:hypothetical protein
LYEHKKGDDLTVIPFFILSFPAFFSLRPLSSHAIQIFGMLLDVGARFKVIGPGSRGKMMKPETQLH